METQITALVSEVFVCQQSRDIQQPEEQLTRDNAAAVRETMLVHAQPMLCDGASLGCEQLSANPLDHTKPDDWHQASQDG